ncbi:MAG: SEC-C domain-containing protein [Myxococcales bacterium]|nr:SEC-C domain-containing protein [Myxococcales bacterium]MCB9538266.1 SEC-C domain-containing protein [Myxococcales bacterium]
MATLGRNAPCHCGSGKKYKHCHLDADRAASGAPGVQRPEADPRPIGAAPYVVLGVGVVVAIGVGLWKGLAAGLVVAAAWGLGLVAWMSFRDPPPPNDNPGNPAALDFGRKD